MSRYKPKIQITDIHSLPPRLTTDEVCALARFGPWTLKAKVDAGGMPAPVHRGRPNLYNRDEVLIALGLRESKEHTRPSGFTLANETWEP